MQAPPTTATAGGGSRAGPGRAGPAAAGRWLCAALRPGRKGAGQAFPWRPSAPGRTVVSSKTLGGAGCASSPSAAEGSVSRERGRVGTAACCASQQKGRGGGVSGLAGPVLQRVGPGEASALRPWKGGGAELPQ